MHGTLNMFTKPCLYLKSKYILLQTFPPHEVTQQVVKRIKQVTIYFHYLFLESLFFKEFLTKWKPNLNPQVFKPTCHNSYFTECLQNIPFFPTK